MALALLLLTLQSVAAQTLEDALIEAYLHNPDLSAEQAALRAKDTRVPQARAGDYPNLTATLQRQYTRGDGRSAFVFPDEPGVINLSPYEEILETQDADFTIATLALKQNLDARRRHERCLGQGGKAGPCGPGQPDLGVEQTVLLNAANAYVDVWRDRGLMAEAQLNLERLSDRLTATRRRLELGEVAQTDLAQAEAARARGQADRDQGSANLASSEATYERAIGMPKAVLGEPHAILELPRSLEESHRWPMRTPTSCGRPWICRRRARIVDIAFANLLPSIDLAGQLNYSDDPNPTYLHQKSAQIGITLTVPLFQGGGPSAKVRETNQTVQQRQSQLDGVSGQIRQQVRTSWNAIVAARSAVESYHIEADSNALALRGVERENSLGLRTVLDVLNAQYTLFQSRSNLLRAQADLVNASYKLKSAIGQFDGGRSRTVGRALRPGDQLCARAYPDLRPRQRGSVAIPSCGGFQPRDRRWPRPTGGTRRPAGRFALHGLVSRAPIGHLTGECGGHGCPHVSANDRTPRQRGRFDAALRQCSRTRRRWRATSSRTARSRPSPRDVIQASQTVPVLVDFWAPWCGPCKQLTPLLEKVVRAAKGKVKLVKIDIDQNPRARPAAAHPVGADGLRVRRWPAGGPALPGAQPESQIKALVDRLIGTAAAIWRRMGCWAGGAGCRGLTATPARPRACSSSSWPRSRPSRRRWAGSPAASSPIASSPTPSSCSTGRPRRQLRTSPSPAPRRPWRWPRSWASWSIR